MKGGNVYGWLSGVQIFKQKETRETKVMMNEKQDFNRGSPIFKSKVRDLVFLLKFIIFVSRVSFY